MDKEQPLPDGWKMVTFSDVCQIERGITFPASEKSSEASKNNIACLRTASVQENVVWKNLMYVPKDYVKSEHKLVYQNDILISMANSRELVGKVSFVTYVPTESTFGAFIAVIRVFSGIDPKFLFYFLRFDVTLEKLRRTASQSVNIANLSLDEIYSTTIPLVPITEQRRIVAAIEQQFSRLDAAVTSLRHARAKLKRQRAAILKAAVEGTLTSDWRAQHPASETAEQLLHRILNERRVKWEAEQLGKKKVYKEPEPPDTTNLPELPEGWVWVSVEQLITYLRNGLPQKPDTSPPGNRILRINAVRPMHVDLDEVRYLTLSEQEVEGYFIENGDILFTRYNGSLDLLGVAGMVRSCYMPTLHPDKLIRVKTVLSEPLSNYVELVYNHATFSGRERCAS